LPPHQKRDIGSLASGITEIPSPKKDIPWLARVGKERANDPLARLCAVGVAIDKSESSAAIDYGIKNFPNPILNDHKKAAGLTAFVMSWGRSEVPLRSQHLSAR
jgi:hypothetical protein